MPNYFRCLSIAMVTAVLTTSANAQEYFGDFLDKLKGTFITEAPPRPQFKLESDFRFKDPNGLLWIAPSGVEVDGASIPQPFWSLIGGPFEGAYINASVIHDHYCRTKQRTAHDTHRNFYYGMRASQVPDWKAKLMHWAVSTFGPSWKLEKRVTMKQTCSSLDALHTTCTSSPVTEVVMVEIPAADLSDPVVLAAAVNKVNAVARTLLTSNGKILDVTVDGQVTASFEGAEKSANAYRQVFASKEFVSSPARLGILSTQTTGGLNNVRPWSGNRVPKLNDAIFLTPQTLPMVERSVPFKLDPRGKDLVTDQVDLKSLETSIHLKKGSQ